MRGLALVLTLLISAPSAAQETSFSVFNRTGQAAIGLHVGGGADLLRGRTLPAGAGVRVSAPGCRADLRLVLASGEVLDWNGVNICATRAVFFTAAVPGRPRATASAPAPADGQPGVAAVQRAPRRWATIPGRPTGCWARARARRSPPSSATGPADDRRPRPGDRRCAARRDRRGPSAVDGKPPPIGEASPSPGPRNGKPPPGVDRPCRCPPASAVPRPARPAPAQPDQNQVQRRASTGTGFIVAPGKVLTNHHVVDGCRRTVGVLSSRRRVDLTVGGRDARRDLALLSGPADMGPALAFREGPARRGDEVVTYGFPLTGILGSGPTLTTGEISALTGLRDDPDTMIISAPVQAGNSGGPLLDRAGNVIGVIVAKLAALRIAERTGDLPQNVNIAIQGRTALEFLRRNGVEPRRSPSIAHYPAAEVGEIAHPSTVLIECFK